MATRIGAVLVGTVNNTATEDTAAVTASASAPLAVSPQATTLTVPPYAGRGVALRLAAPRDSTPGGYDVHVQSVTFAPVPARYVRLEATAASGGSYASAAEVSAR